MKNLSEILFLIVSLLFLFFISYSQNPDVKRTWHWYFGDGAGIDFSSGTAVADTSAKTKIAYSGCSVISDTAGNLLFYTNGTVVWNSNHDTMQNSTGLNGGGTPQQGSVIVPQPGNDSIYFIFHQPGMDGYDRKLSYSIVNVKKNKGLGEVVAKNIQLLKPNCENLSSVHHANKCDIWVMAHEHLTNNWHAFLVTANGVDTIPVTTVIGNQLQDTSKTPDHPEWPMLNGSRFSSDGAKFVTDVFWDNYNYPVNMDTIELFDFDNSTGKLSNLITIPDSGCLGLEFSPDGTKLYNGTGTYDAQVYQYDISSNNQSIILSTKTLLYYDDYWNITDFQHTVDKKIIAVIPFHDSLPIIYNPNNLGTSCNLVTAALSLNGRKGNTSLPNFIQSYFGEDTTRCYSAPIESLEKISRTQNDEILIYPNPFNISASIFIDIEVKQYLSNINLNLYDVFGKQVRKFTVHDSPFTIYRNNLSEGIYFLKVQIKNKFFTTKLLITN